MNGIDVNTGQALEGGAHLAQSIADILGTPLGSRIMRRDYGSLLFDLIDRPINAATRMLMHAATAIALRRWEPRLKLRKVNLSKGGADGSLTITIEGDRTDVPTANSRVTLSIPLRSISGSTAAATSAS